MILFGVRFFRKGLDKLFGENLGLWIQRLTGTRFKAFLSGLCAAIVSPSSTSMSVLTVRSVQDGHVTARQGLAMMFGADVGLTAMVMMIALQVDVYAPVLMLVGMVLFQFTTSTRSRGVGQVLLSLGFIFLGMVTIKSAAGSIAGHPDLIALVRVAERHPFGMAMLGCVIAMALQSSTATIGLVIGLGAAGAVKLPLGLAVVAGANVGIAVTMLLIGWEQVESRRLAVGNLIGKILVANAGLLAIGPLAAIIQLVPGKIDQHVAYAHTGFNVTLALCGLPLIDVFDWLVRRWIPDPVDPTSHEPAPRHIHAGLVDSLSLSLGQSTQEILCVAETIRAMLGDMFHAIKSNHQRFAMQLSQRHHQVKLIDLEITRLINLMTEQKDFSKKVCHLRYLLEMEMIGRIIDEDMSQLVIRKIQEHAYFSDAQWDKLNDYFHKVSENLLITKTAFATRDRSMAKRLLLRNAQMKKQIWTLRQKLRDQRGQAAADPASPGHEVYWQIHFHLWRVNRCISNVALAILEETHLARAYRQREEAAAQQPDPTPDPKRDPPPAIDPDPEEPGSVMLAG